MTHGKIERYHRAMKNEVEVLDYYDLLTLERGIARFVDYHDHQWHHGTLKSV